MATKTATFETGVNGNTVSTADPGSADAWNLVSIPGSGSIVYSNTHAYETLAAKIDGGAGDNPLLQWTVSMGATHFGRAYIYPTTRQAGKILAPVQAGVAYRGSISMDAADGLLDLNDSAGVTHGNTTVPVQTNQWTRIEWMFVQSTTAGQIAVRLFVGANAGGFVPDEVVTTAADLNLGVTVDSFQFGNLDVTTGVTWWDNIVAGAATFPGPLVQNGGPLAWVRA